jgi:hypothetical protein
MLYDASQRASEYVLDSSPGDSEAAIGVRNRSASASRRLFRYFGQKKVWLPKDCAKKVEAYTEQLLHLQLERQESEKVSWRRDLGPDAWTTIATTLPAAREALADELRRLVDPRLPRNAG